MKKNFPWWYPVIGSNEKELILQVLDDNYTNEGKFTQRFEKAIAQRIGSKHAVAVTSGTAALFLSLKACNIGPGDEVIVPDLTFIATANAVDMCGAIPVLVDIKPDTLNIDPQAIKQAITAKTKAVIPVHITGRAVDMNAVLDIADKYNLFIIEDAAEAFMSKFNGKYLGTIGTIGCFSFSPNKIITTGQGGLIATDDDEMHHRLRELKDQGRPVRGTGGDDIHNSRGYNFKFTNLQAALGLGQLSYLDERMVRLRRTHEVYAKNLQDIDKIKVLTFKTKKGELPLWTDVLVENRDGLVKYLKSINIDCRKFWNALHTQKPYETSYQKYPVANQIGPKALWLPSAFTLEDEDILYIISKIKNALVCHTKRLNSHNRRNIVIDPKNVLLTGGNGTLGSEIIKSKLFDNLLTPSKKLFDITKPALIDKYLRKNNIDYIIHSAALARMGLCDEIPEKAIETNIIGTSNLVCSALKFEENEKKNIRLIHISTDAVYNGKTGNYSEKDATIPYNNYGWSKLGAECAVRLLANYAIIRTRFFNPANIPFDDSATNIFTSSMPINELVSAIYLILFSKFIGVINVGDQKMSEFNLYKKFKPSLKPCKRNDITKHLNFEIAKDSTMYCDLWYNLKENNNLL